MGLTISELTQVQSLIQEVKTMVCTNCWCKCFRCSENKKDDGVVEKINQTRAIVNMKGRSYNVPFSMFSIKG